MLEISGRKPLISRENKIAFLFSTPEKAQEARFWMETSYYFDQRIQPRSGVPND